MSRIRNDVRIRFAPVEQLNSAPSSLGYQYTR